MSSNSGRGGHCERCGCANNNHTFGICGGGSGKGSKYVACTFEWSRCITGGHNDVTEVQYIDCKRCPNHPDTPLSNGEIWGSQPDNEYPVYTADQLGIPRPKSEDKSHGSKGKRQEERKGKKDKGETGGSSAVEYWTWSDKHSNYYYMNEDGSYEWYWIGSSEYNKYYHIKEDGSCEWRQVGEASSSADITKSSREKGKGKHK